MEVQVFGVKKNPDTRKALRFFAERRIRTHFVDFAERAPSLGELRRFTLRFGMEALIDRDSRAFADRGLHSPRLSEEKWLDKVMDEPLQLQMLLVAQIGREVDGLTVGL